MGTGPVVRVMTVLLQVDMFEASLQPGASLLQDWLTSAHHTQLAVEMVVAGLETLGRGDVAAVIREERGEEEEAAQVFISYQWDNQEEALRVRQYLEQVQTILTAVTLTPSTLARPPSPAGWTWASWGAGTGCTSGCTRPSARAACWWPASAPATSCPPGAPRSCSWQPPSTSR